MNSTAEMGASFEKDGHTYYPTMVFAQSRGCLYGIYVGATMPGYNSSVSAGEFFAAEPDAQLELEKAGHCCSGNIHGALGRHL